jgi:hypothetical protein
LTSLEAGYKRLAVERRLTCACMCSPIGNAPALAHVTAVHATVFKMMITPKLKEYKFAQENYFDQWLAVFSEFLRCP